MAKKKPSKSDKPDKDPALREIYDRIKREFSAADLQKYTEIEEGIPAAQVLAEMEAIHEREMHKRKRV